MTKPCLAICLDDLRLDVRASLDRARALAFQRVDVAATDGPISPQELSRTGQRHLLKHMADLGLCFASLRGPVGGSGYADGAGGERRLDLMRRVIGLAAALRVGVVSTTLGRATGTEDPAEAARLREALTILADDADRTGVAVAVETAGIGVESLKGLLAEINCPGLGSCCDSGAMLMQGEDPHRVADTLAGRIHLVRARDAVRGSADAAGYEVPHGEGVLDAGGFLAALTEAGFRGDIVLSRTTGADPAADLLRAKQAFEKVLR